MRRAVNGNTTADHNQLLSSPSVTMRLNVGWLNVMVEGSLTCERGGPERRERVASLGNSLQVRISTQSR